MMAFRLSLILLTLCSAWPAHALTVPVRSGLDVLAAETEITGRGTVVNYRITEVYFASLDDHDHIAITNLGSRRGNFGQVRVSVQAGPPLSVVHPFYLPVGGKVTLHLNQSGSNTWTDLFFPGVTLDSAGSVGLYVAEYDEPDSMVDFVQWGAGGQLNEAAAFDADLWRPGEFVPRVAWGHSIQFCAGPDQHGASFWKGHRLPGELDCLTPTAKATWGRLKSLYR